MSLDYRVRNGPLIDKKETTFPMLHTRAIIINANQRRSTTIGKRKPITLPSKYPEEKYSFDTPAKLTQAKLSKHSEDTDLSKDMLGPESPPELRRSWYVEGHIKFEVISSVLAHRYQRSIRQRCSPCEGPLSME
ncbi:hypothetical protein Tco_0131382 [Tanacetum coccineum]